MDKHKKKIIKTLSYLYLILFPFGQLIRINVGFPIHPIEVVSVFSFIYLLRKNFKSLPIWIKNFSLVAIFSYLLSFSFFSTENLITGGFYLVRLFGFAGLFMLFSKFIKLEGKKKTVNLLLGSLMSVLVFGFIQYLFFPNLKPLEIFGWDDHLFRLTGTFFDPGFTGLLLIFGLILSKYHKIQTSTLKRHLIPLFFILGILLTYSRASFLSLIIVLIYTLIRRSNYKKIAGVLVVFAFLIFLLPKPGGEGVNILRTASINSRIENYVQTIEIIKEYPVFGVGFNNLCIARYKFLGDFRTNSNACSGSDSSLLLVLATTGVVGLFIFVHSMYKDVKNTKKGKYKSILIEMLIALFVSSLFVNSLFYPWIIGVIIIIQTLNTKV